MGSYFGKFRGKVTDVNDPEKRGRIRAKIPFVFDEAKSPWCEPCIPVANDFWGDFCVPKKGDTVWVEFEKGDPNWPIWSGGWYGVNNSPVKDYSDSSSVRIISFENCYIEMRKNEIIFKVQNSSLTLNSQTISKLNDLIGG